MKKNKTRNKHSKIHSKPIKINRKHFLMIFLTSLFAVVFMLVSLPGGRLLFFPSEEYLENNISTNNANNTSISKVWQNSVNSVNITTKQFADGSAASYADIKADEKISGDTFKIDSESYLDVLGFLSENNVFADDLSFYGGNGGGSGSDGRGSGSICAEALDGFYSNLAEQLKLFKSKTDQFEIKTQKISSAADEAAKQPEYSEEQAESQESSGQTLDFTIVLMSLINNARNSSGIQPLSLNSTLNVIAKSRSDDMIARDYFSHVFPNGKDIQSLIEECAIMYKLTGENLLYCSSPSMVSPELFFTSWMESDTHRANILDSGYTQIGIALSFSADKAISTLVFLG